MQTIQTCCIVLYRVVSCCNVLRRVVSCCVASSPQSKFKFSYTSDELKGQWGIDIHRNYIKAGSAVLSQTLVGDPPDKATLVGMLKQEFPLYDPGTTVEQKNLQAGAYTKCKQR